MSRRWQAWVVSRVVRDADELACYAAGWIYTDDQWKVRV